MEWYDYSFLKIGMVFMGFFLVTLWADLQALVLSISWEWHFLVALTFLLPVAKKSILIRGYLSSTKALRNHNVYKSTICSYHALP